MTLFYVPIEKLEERYTAQWYDSIQKAFVSSGYDVFVVDGAPLSNTVGVGTFLDINSTIAYKNSQMIKIAELFHCGKVKDGDIFFFGDGEYWGMESLRLMANMNNVKVKIYSFFHAASYTMEDAFEIAAPYQKYTELGWIMACDKIFVGSEYHKKVIIEKRIDKYSSDKETLSGKIVVTGNPLFKEHYKQFDSKKKKQVILSNRFDWEKRPNISLDFAVILKDRYPDLKFILTTSRKEFKSNKKWLVEYANLLRRKGIIEIYSGLTKDEYHEKLAESRVLISNSIEENFGYCIAEALLYNTYPLVKNDFSHPELCNGDDRLLFNDEDEILEKIDLLLNSKFSVTEYVNKYYNSMFNIVKEISV